MFDIFIYALFKLVRRGFMGLDMECIGLTFRNIFLANACLRKSTCLCIIHMNLISDLLFSLNYLNFGNMPVEDFVLNELKSY